MKHGGSLLHSQVPATFPYPDADRFIPCPTSHILKTHLDIILPSSMPGSSKWVLASCFCTKCCVHLFPICATCSAHLILLYFSTQTILGEDYISLIKSAGISSKPGNLCLFIFSIFITTSNALRSGTSGSAVCLPNVTNTMYIEQLREMFPLPSQNTLAVCKQIISLILYYIRSRMVTHLNP